MQIIINIPPYKILERRIIRLTHDNELYQTMARHEREENITLRAERDALLKQLKEPIRKEEVE